MKNHLLLFFVWSTVRTCTYHHPCLLTIASVLLLLLLLRLLLLMAVSVATIAATVAAATHAVVIATATDVCAEQRKIIIIQ